ncbi:outer membrane transport energization protein ExbB [Prosthecobacter fusiformis]|uniref:Outer membrane transport energization protein ExbB n=1 Tax=Prosthecobacter fusiformis TaxID=48464 RepID=A0A4R7S630_9BACT|nr:MotA/TolQ/ExbB proton channel family protein [Prosthecobacter fusiformis]TDU72865.1 outer membrane transport energization protein ExbB [Prosthecobacter fusiformis]
MLQLPLANVVIKFIHDGGPIMYPILVVGGFAICVLVERIFWWLRFSARRSAKQLDQVYAALEGGDQAKAISLSETTTDPVVRMIHHGLKHQHSSMQGALEVAAGHELQAAGRFLGAMDTVVTLGPLLGLLGTVTGIMGSFSSIGDSELAVEKVTGGIGEALIATAAGLGIAIATLVPMNYFHSRLAKLQFDLEAAANNVLILAAQHGFDQVHKKH